MAIKRVKKMEQRRMILDCDPGHDDAIAIMLAGKSPSIDLLGITVVAGNQTIEKTAQNALNVVEYLKLDVPVFAGASEPLIKERVICAQIHGESGLDGFTFPINRTHLQRERASDFIVNSLMKYDDVTIVATGPLTNIALALKNEPLIKSHIKEIVLMGGSIGSGNVSPAAEFNILTDPEAADIVFRSGCIIKMCGLDVTREVLVLKEVIERMNKIHNDASKLFVDLMRVFNANQKKIFGFDGAPLHDPVTIVSLIDKKVVHFEYMNVEIDISRGPSYGRTNCDRFNYLHRQPNVYVATRIDVKKYWNIIEEGLKRY